MEEHEISRTEYSARNTSVAMISRILAIFMGYLTRVVFARNLSESYMGVSGLFTDILNVLAFSELGIGTAITYALYRPIAVGDIEKQKSLMRLFRTMYRVVAGIIVTAGICILPFLNLLVKDPGDVEHLTVIYLLYLLNSVVSYLFIYKRTLMDACQLSYIGVLYQMGFLMAQYVLQMIVLAATGNFILYLVIMLVCTVGNNVFTSREADRRYPFLREREVVPLTKEERGGILKNIQAMFMHKMGNVVVNNTDNILISVMIGIGSVGGYSNNYLVIGSVRQMLTQAFQGIAASVGNLGVTEEKEKIHEIFLSCFFIGQWMYGFAAICLYELIGPFVEMSFGGQYRFSQVVVFVLCLNFYVTGMRQAAIIFRDSMGLFWYDRYKAPVEALINLVASILLTLRFGIVGIFLGTFVSTMTTSFWVEPYVLYKKEIKAPIAGYFLRYGLYAAVTFGAGAATDAVCGLFSAGVGTELLFRIPICALLPNVIFLICFVGTKEFRLVWDKMMGIVRKRWRRV